MLMSLPNSVGIDTASANEDVFYASGRLVYRTRRHVQTGTIVLMQSKVNEVDEPAEVGGD